MAYTEWGISTHSHAIMCIHGLIRNGRDFDRLASTLSRDNHLLCPDIAGRGQSDWLTNPADYNYAQYIQDVTGLITHKGLKSVDWIGTSMGGIMGMFLAAIPESPIRRLVINDVGPFIPLVALQRIAAYVAQPPDVSSREEIEAYLQKTYAPFGITRKEDWHHMALHSARQKLDGRWTLAYDPMIAAGLSTLKEDVNFWEIYDQIRCPVLLIRGKNSDVLSADVAHAMTQRGPHATLVEIPDAGHAPSLMDDAQISVIADFLRTA